MTIPKHIFIKKSEHISERVRVAAGAWACGAFFFVQIIAAL